MTERMGIIFKIFVVFLIMLVTFIIPMSLQLYFGNSRNGDSQNRDSVPQQTLQITSIPPKQVVSGSFFEYKVVYMYTGSDAVSLLVEEKPSWLVWDSQSFSFSGQIPDDIQVFTLRFTVSAGILSSQQNTSIRIVEEQLLVTPSVTPSPTAISQVTIEESEDSPFLVSGTSIDEWEDPYHPQASLPAQERVLHVENTTGEVPTAAGSIVAQNESTRSVLGASSINISKLIIPAIVIGIVLFTAAVIIMFRSQKFTQLPSSEGSVIKTRSGLVITSYSHHD